MPAKKIPTEPIRPQELVGLDSSQLFELAFSCADRALGRKGLSDLPQDRLRQALQLKRDSLAGKRTSYELKEEIRALKGVYEKARLATIVWDAPKWHVLTEDSHALLLVCSLVSKLLRTHAHAKRPERLAEEISGILEISNEAAQEYARFQKKDDALGFTEEIAHQRRALNFMRSMNAGDV